MSLRALLPRHLVHGIEAPANYSVLIGQNIGRGGAGFHFLYRGAAPVVRTRDPRRLLRALVSFLTSHSSGPAGLELVAVALVGPNDRAVLAPYALRSALDRVERRLNAQGFRLVDTPWAVVDADSKELVVPSAGNDVHWPALERIVEVAPLPARADYPIQPGRYPIRAWALAASADVATMLSRGAAVMKAAALLVRPGELGTQGCLEALARVVGPVPMVEIRWSSPEELVARLVQLR